MVSWVAIIHPNTVGYKWSRIFHLTGVCAVSMVLSCHLQDQSQDQWGHLLKVLFVFCKLIVPSPLQYLSKAYFVNKNVHRRKHLLTICGSICNICIPLNLHAIFQIGSFVNFEMICANSRRPGLLSWLNFIISFCEKSFLSPQRLPGYIFFTETA